MFSHFASFNCGLNLLDTLVTNGSYIGNIQSTFYIQYPVFFGALIGLSMAFLRLLIHHKTIHKNSCRNQNASIEPTNQRTDGRSKPHIKIQGRIYNYQALIEVLKTNSIFIFLRFFWEDCNALYASILSGTFVLFVFFF